MRTIYKVLQKDSKVWSTDNFVDILNYMKSINGVMTSDMDIVDSKNLSTCLASVMDITERITEHDCD